MENADALDLSKENIQPLKKGRNTAQLGIALQAQTDAQLQQMLQKKQEWYEMQIRTYDGDDPLGLWYDYINWVEQSFPKHGLEGNLGVLLPKCFQAFKNEERYKQDPRFVQLWVKYIEMQTDSRRSELYKCLYSQGIGTTSTEFYKCWAYEFQIMNDFKHADAIYQLGFKHMAQPAAELQMSYNQFQLTVAQFVLKSDETEDAPESALQLDQRQAMAALKPVGKKSVAPAVRVGANVRSSAPGTLQLNNNGPIARPGPSSRAGPSSWPSVSRGSNMGPISIYQERSDAEADDLAGIQQRSGALPAPQALNKENTMKPGPWTSQGLGPRKHQSSSGIIQPAFQRHPGFEVHKDEGAEMDGCRQDPRPHGQAPGVLKTRKTLDDGIEGAMALFEPPDPNMKPMYKKNQIYAGGMELQLEELMAIDYMRGKFRTAPKSHHPAVFSHRQGEDQDLHREAREQEMLHRQAEEQEMLRRQAEEQEMLRRQAEEQEMLRRQAEEQEMLRRQAEEQEMLRRQAEEQEILRRRTEEREILRRQAEQRDIMHRQAEEQEILRRQGEQQEILRRQAEEREMLHRQAEKHAQILPPGSQLHHQHNLSDHGVMSPHSQLQPNSFGSSIYGGYHVGQPTAPDLVLMHDQESSPSSPESHVSADRQVQRKQTIRPSNQSMYNQSMTVHTKLAMNEMGYLWRSPSDVKSAETSRGEILPASMSGDARKNNSFRICQDETVTVPVTRPQAQGFQICRDETTSVPLLAAAEASTFQICRDSDAVSSQHSVGSGVESQRKMAPLLDECEKMDTNSLPPFQHSSPQQLFEDPQTINTYLKNHPQFSVFREEDSAPKVKFQVFCDEGEASNLSSQIPKNPSPTTVAEQKIAKEKENLYKFPLADLELMEECGVTPVEESVYLHHTGGNAAQHMEPVNMQQHHMENLHIHFVHPHQVPASQSVSQSQEEDRVGHFVHPHQAPTSPSLAQPQKDESVMHLVPPQYHAPASPSVAQSVEGERITGLHSNPKTPSYHKEEGMQCLAVPTVYADKQERMDDDFTVAAPSRKVDLSETCNTQIFFMPKMTSSTPLHNSGKVQRSHQDPNSSLFVVETVETPEDPNKVPPLRLYRVRESLAPNDQQLSTILETSKEKYNSVSSSSSKSSSSSVSRYTIYTTSQRHSLAGRDSISTTGVQDAPQPNLSLIQESSEQSGSSQKSDRDQTSPHTSTILQRMQKGDVNPFDSRLLEELLVYIGFPLPHHREGYFVLNSSVPAKRQNNLVLNGETYNIPKVLGEGAYAKVLKGVHVQTQREVALKIQKPSWKWEYYICREIQQRLTNRQLATAFMQAEQIFLYNNGSVILTELLPYGTLLTLVNKVVATTKRQLSEVQVFFLVDQLLSAVAALHSCKIIHGDLKPDNILLRSLPSLESDTPCIQLIDFGRSIDMTLMPEGISFTQVVKTDGFTCIEMQTGRPWTYQTDLYGLANIAHCLLRGEYMRVQEDRMTGRWTIQAKLPRQYKRELWLNFFDALLNIESCETMPDLEALRTDILSHMNQARELKPQTQSLWQIMMER